MEQKKETNTEGCVEQKTVKNVSIDSTESQTEDKFSPILTQQKNTTVLETSQTENTTAGADNKRENTMGLETSQTENTTVVAENTTENTMGLKTSQTENTTAGAKNKRATKKSSQKSSLKFKELISNQKLKPLNFLFLAISGFINAFGVTVFLTPVKLYDSGISGTSILLSQLTPEWLSLSVFLLVLNIPLFLIGLKKQGKIFTVYSVFSVIMYSLGAWLINDIIPLDVSVSSPLAGTDLLLCAVFGGILSGVGSGMAIRYGGAMDGVEVMAVIFAKKIGLSVGSFVMAYNALLYVLCGIIMQSWALPLYSIIAYAVGSKVVDFIVDGIDRNKSVMIVTNHPKDVCAALSLTFEQGMTVIKATGFYSNSEKTVVYIVLNRFQIARMKQIVHSIDQSAYISICDVADVFKAIQK